MIRGYAFTGVYYVLSLVFVLITLPLLSLPGRAAVSWSIRQYCRCVRFVLHWIGGVKVRIEGKENLPDGPYILAAKHQSWGDGIIIYPEIRDLTFVTGDHLAKFPLVGGILEKLGAIVIDTCGGGDRKVRSLEEGLVTAKSEGRRVLIYPEGHLAPPGKHFRYKAGVWHMQRETNLPVVPVASNLGAFWTQQDIRKRSGTATVRILSPLESGLPKDLFLERLTTQIETECAALLNDTPFACEATRLISDPKPRKVD